MNNVAIGKSQAAGTVFIGLRSTKTSAPRDFFEEHPRRYPQKYSNLKG